jgi:hypothetical protein
LAGSKYDDCPEQHYLPYLKSEPTDLPDNYKKENERQSN